MMMEGTAFGHIKEAVGDVVFNTRMQGYQELLTDPSSYGQLVVMTYPLIGNYGISLDDMDSHAPFVRAFIMSEEAKTPSNWRCEMELSGYLKQNRILGLQGIDTRALTKILSKGGEMKGIITTRELTPSQIEQKFKMPYSFHAVEQVTTAQAYELAGSGPLVAILDLGVKRSILRGFHQKGCHMTVLPAHTSVGEILGTKPAGIILSNGPGNPEDIPEIIDKVKQLIGKVPIMGIGLGHQILALALGAKIEELPVGHRGVNHPVKSLETGKISITVQNHQYIVSKEALPADLQVTHQSVNDGTIEGFRHTKLPLRGIQFHPEVWEGLKDPWGVADEFVTMIGGHVHA